MKDQMTAKSRKKLKNKMATVFSENIKMLSADLKDVLLDDLVTAFENRLIVLNRTRQNTQFITTIMESVEYETIET
jgi:hypothetical protein